jgi:hypothetical protein
MVSAPAQLCETWYVTPELSVSLELSCNWIRRREGSPRREPEREQLPGAGPSDIASAIVAP